MFTKPHVTFKPLLFKNLLSFWLFFKRGLLTHIQISWLHIGKRLSEAYKLQYKEEEEEEEKWKS